jgi:hypothetical protein
VTLILKGRSERIVLAAAACMEDPIAWGIALGYNGDARGRKKPSLVHRRMVNHWTGEGGKTRWRSAIIPRDHGKSTWGGIVLTSWRKLRDPWRRTVIAGGDMKLAGQQIGTIRERLLGKITLDGEQFWLCDIFQWMEPLGRREQASSICEGFNVVGREGRGAEPCFFAKSPGSRQAGDHPTDGHLDDLTTEQSKDSWVRRQNELDFLIGLRPYMAFGYESWVTHAGTPWHYWDTTAFIGQSPEWVQMTLGVEDIIEPGSDILCPSCLTREEWEIIKADPHKSDEYRSAQYLCRPAPSAHAIISEKLVEDMTHRRWTTTMLSEGRLARYGTILAWDPTHRLKGTREKGSSNGIVVFKAVPNKEIMVPGLDPTRNIWFPIRAMEFKGGADDARRWIETEARNLHPDLAEIWIEAKAAQRFLAPWLETSVSLAGVDILPLECNEGDFPYRLQGTATAARKGYIIMPPDFPGREVLVRQLMEYPVGDRDDVAAAWALVSSQYARYGQILPPETSPVYPFAATTWPVPRGPVPDVWSM